MVVRSSTEFADAVRAHPLERLALDEAQLEQLRHELLGESLLVIGESHGARETPAVLYTVMCALDLRTIALEWSHEEMDSVVQSFLRSGSFDFEALWALPPSAEIFCGDGRITAGHFTLLERLRREQRLNRVILFDRLDPDPAPDDWRVRDREMAERLLAEWGGHGAALVAVGAFHAQHEEPGTMAHELARHVAVRCATIHFAAGLIWGRGALHPAAGTVPSSGIKLDLPVATPAVVPGQPL